MKKGTAGDCTLQDAHGKNLRDALASLKAIQKGLGKSGRARDWGDVGSMNLVARRLAEVAKILK